MVTRNRWSSYYVVFSKNMELFNQLTPEEVGRIKGLRETNLTYRQIKEHIGRPITTISSVFPKKPRSPRSR